MNTTVTLSLVPADFFYMLRDQMILYGYRPHTIKAYLRQVQGFLHFNYPVKINGINEQSVRDYLNHLVQRGLSRSTIDQAAKAIEIFYYEVIRGQLDLSGFKRPQKKRPNPEVLTSDEIYKIAVSTKNPKHRLMIELAYSAGLRVSELVGIKIRHINLEKFTLFVPGFDGKNRTTIFSEHLRGSLIRQIEETNVDQYLFPSKRNGMLTTRTIAKFFKKALVSSGLKKLATPHSLRQSFTKNMLNQGTDPITLQSILGQRTLTNFSPKSKKAA